MNGNQSGHFLSKLTPTIDNSWILLRLIGQLNNHKIDLNHMHNLETVNVSKQWVLLVVDIQKFWIPASLEVQILFNFMQFLGKFYKILCWRPPPPEG